MTSIELAIDPGWTVGESMAHIIKAEGTEFLSAYPTTEFIDLAAQAKLRPVICRQERVGVGIADGYSRVNNGRPAGVFAMQWGPGLENSYAGIATAFSDSTPLLCIAAGIENDRLDEPRFHSAAKLADIAKSVRRLRAPEDVVDVMRRAFGDIRNGRGGPVIVEVPRKMFGEGIGEAAGRTYRSVPHSRPGPDREAIERAADLIAESRRPVIVAGQGALYSDCALELVALAERAGVPVGTTLEGKSAFPEDHPLALGAGSASMPVPLADALSAADLIVGIGVSFSRHIMAIEPPSGVDVVQITTDASDIGRDCDVTVGIVSDARLAIVELTEALRLRKPRSHDSVADALARDRSRWLSEWEPRLSSNEQPISPYRVVGELCQLPADELIVTHDAGSPRDQLLPFYRANQSRSYLGWGKSHALGSGLGLAMGAKLARPDRMVVNLMGDAAFGMVGLDLETAVRHEIPITTIVNNNAIMANEQDALVVSHELYQTRDIGGNYSDIALALGAWARRVENPGDLSSALLEARRHNDDGRPALIEVITSKAKQPLSCSRATRQIYRRSSESAAGETR